MGGRLQHSDLQYDQKHQVILPKTSRLAQLMTEHAHLITLHGGLQEVIQYIRQEAWIISGRSLAKAVVGRCVVCRRHQHQAQQQQMASLPRDRVLVCPPFTNTGCDYAGPFYVRHGSARKTHTKVYAVIFVCMSTKAVHIE